MNDAVSTTDLDQQARLDLAAAYRLLAHHGWSDVIFNHAAMRCPSNPRHFLIMCHHGITTVGETPREAFSLKEFVRSARIQLMMESTHGSVLEIPAKVCERVAAQYEKHDKGRASAEWPACLRMLDKIDAGFCD